MEYLVPGTLFYCFGAIQLRAYNTVGLRPGKVDEEITTFTVVVIVLNRYARKQPLLLLLLLLLL